MVWTDGDFVLPGGETVVGMMTEVSRCEYGGLREDGEPEYPGLKMVLSYSYRPDLEWMNKDGQTILNQLLHLVLDCLLHL